MLTCLFLSARLDNVIVCAGAVVGARSNLSDCDVGPGIHVAPDTSAKNEKLVGGHEDSEEGSEEDSEEE